MNVGTLFAKLKLDPSEFETGLSRAKTAGDNAASQTQSTFGRMGSFIQNTLSTAAGFITANVFGRIIDGVKSLAGGMISGNAEFERYQTQFGVLLKSAPAAKERLAELAKFGATTPFELPELVRADKVLTAFGLHSEDTAQKFGVSGSQILTTIGDVSAGTGVSFEELSVTFGKFASGATGEAIARFQELGIATKEEMAGWGLQFSKSGQLLTPAREAFTVLEAHVRSKFGGMMDAQSKTFEGMVSNLQDWIGATLRQLGQPIFEVLKDKLGVVLAFLGDPATQAAITAFAQGLATTIGQAMDWLSNTAIPALMTAWTNLQPTIAAVWAVLQQAPAVFQSIMAAAQPVIDFISANLQPIMAGLAAMLLAVVVPAFVSWAIAAGSAAIATAIALAPVILAVAAIGLAVGVLYKAWTEDWGGIRTNLTDWWEQTGRPIFELVKNWLAVNIPIALQKLSDFWTNVLLPAIRTVGAWITGTLIPILGDVVTWLVDNVGSAVKTLSDFWTGTLWPALQKVWAFVDANIIPILRVLGQTWIAMLKTEVRLLAELWTTVLWPALQKVWAFIDAYIIPIVRDLAEQKLAQLKASTQALTDFWNGTLYPLIQKVAGILQSELSSKLDMVKTSFGYVRDAVGWVIDKLQDFQRWLNTIHIPEWLQGHSPPPLADWFSYIGEAAGTASGGIAGVVSQLYDAQAAAAALASAWANLPAISGLDSLGLNLGSNTVAGAFGGGSTVDNSRSVSIGSVTQVNNNHGTKGRSLSDEIGGLQGLSSRL